MKYLLLPLLLGLAACQTSAGSGAGNPLTSPRLSPIGQGLSVAREPLPASFTAPERHTTGSLWGQNNQGLFHDLRAKKLGDVLTVIIDINDKAQFDNASGRSREAGSKGSLAAALGFGGFGAADRSGKLSGSMDGSASTHSKGQGTIDRSEKLHLSVAAVVSEVLPDGNLLVSGSQEVRVNYEVRVLNVAGIVRTLDISADNTIAYDKIAEARVSYGGRGRISEVQQPAWGQRLYDAVAPF
jgi:flagellar L-ring protein precursor FlgH